MALDTRPLVQALREYEEKGGVWAGLERATVRLGKRITAATIARTATGKTTASPETWEALWEARPDIIPPPPWSESGNEDRQDKGPPQADGPPEATVVDLPLVEILVFDLGSGQSAPAPGRLSKLVAVPKQGLVDGTAFAVKVHGESMSPHLNQGDVVVVVPSAPLVQGCLCLAAWPGESGKRLVKRYYRYGQTIVLRSDNPAHEEITLNSEDASRVQIYRITQSLRQE